MVDNIKPERTEEDLLFQVLLDWCVDLGLPIEPEKIDGCEVFFVNDREHAAPDPIVCFDPDVPESLVKTIAAKSPLRAVVRDQCFTIDADNINVEQIFKNQILKPNRNPCTHHNYLPKMSVRLASISVLNKRKNAEH